MSDNRSKTVPEAIVGQLVSRSAYDEALNAIMEGDKRLEAAIARAEKAEAREREIGEELDKATGMVEGLVAENTRFRHAAAETADLLMRGAPENDEIKRLRAAIADAAAVMESIYESFRDGEKIDPAVVDIGIGCWLEKHAPDSLQGKDGD